VILGAALLVLAGIGLFVAGVLTGVTALYWACVAVCAVAAVLLMASRRQAGAAAREKAAPQNAAPQNGPPQEAAPREAAPTTPGTVEAPLVQEPAAASGAAPAGEPVTTDDESPRSLPAVTDTSTGVQATVHRASATGATALGGPTTGSLRAQGRGAHAAADGSGGAARMGEPGIEEVEVTDLLLVVDLTDEVLVVDEHPRYHLEGCRFLAGRETFALPLDEARTDGFTPCALCAPDRHLADRERARKSGM
jgi:hypothetical protein